MKRNEVQEPSKVGLHERSQKRMRSHKSDASSRKRLSYKIEIPAEPVDNSPPLQKRVLEIYDGLPVTLFLAFVTLYVLFADDVRQIAFPASADFAFTIINLVCITIFVTEITVLSIFKEGYVLRFYFWLDLVSLITMTFDLTWVVELMNVGNVSNAANVVQIARAGRASRLGARTARFIRIIRLIRMLKLYKNASATMTNEQDRRNSKVASPATVQPSDRKSQDVKQIVLTDSIKEDRIIESETREKGEDSEHQLPSGADKWEMEKAEMKRNKFKLPPLVLVKKPMKGVEVDDERPPKSSEKRLPVVIEPAVAHLPSEHTSSVKKVSSDDVMNLEIPVETKVGSKLKDEIQKNIILMVLLVLISVPLFTSDTWIETSTVYNRGIYQLQQYIQIQHSFIDNSNFTSQTLDRELRTFIQLGTNMSNPLVYLYFPVNSTCCTFPDNYTYTGIRSLTSIRDTSLVQSTYNSLSIVFDSTDQDTLTSKLNIGRTLFVCVLLVTFSLLFTRDVEQFALEPLENMINTVKRISQNPLQAIIAIENENIIKSTIKDKDEDDEEKKKTEPVILENMIVKIGALLAVGFGQAGSEIIAKNIENHGAVNAVLSGKKIVAIFGFCDIRNFTDATEVLQTKVMNFVNEIAAIVHGVVNRCAGSANKNIGDAFLLVWKFKEKETIISEIDGQTSVSLRKISKVRQTADLAVYSFVKIIAEITKSSILEKYKKNERLRNRIKDYEGVRMGFGLHVGWAIEGGIGSQFKIDASYLSPNVNMSSRLEAATKQFGANILISGELADLMTPRNKELLRKIDCVTVKGSNQPIDLYTVDLSIRNLTNNVVIKPRNHKLTDMEKKRQKVMANTIRQNLLDKLETSKRITENLFLNDQDVTYLREPYTQDFYAAWATGIQAYIKGDWKTALRSFKSTHKMLPDIVDGPSETLISFIQSHKGEAPTDWRGFRELTQK